MQPKIMDIKYTRTMNAVGEGMYLSVLFDNGRCHMVRIQYPFATQEIAKALNKLARDIMQDSTLNGLTINGFSETNNSDNTL